MSISIATLQGDYSGALQSPDSSMAKKESFKMSIKSLRES